MSGLSRARKHLLNFKHVLKTRGSLVLPGSFPPRFVCRGSRAGKQREPRVGQTGLTPPQDLWEGKGPAFFSVINKEKTRNLLKALVEAFPLLVPSLMGSFAAKFQCDLHCRYRFLGGLEGPILLVISCAWSGPNTPLKAPLRGCRRHPGWESLLPPACSKVW